MSKTVICVENLSKQYRLGQVGTGTLSHDLNRWWHQIRGKEDPYLKIGETNDRASKAESAYVWALKDINFEVQQGEVLGIIGKNGAGKSTLLKILSKVTGPTTGTIKAKGRIAALLEVGTGFHPELTGRENIYLNGTLLGMTKREVAAKLDEIVDFAGVARYLDTPVKRYSSGMMVRLGFAVAAHLEPEILIVDEVLAVGDAEFQKKAVGKMQEVSRQGGRTVLFVSHNMVSIKELCTKSCILNEGKLAYSGDTIEAIKAYQKFSGIYSEKIEKLENENIKIEKLVFSETDNSLEAIIRFKKKYPRVAYVIAISTQDGFKFFKSSSSPIWSNQENEGIGIVSVKCKIPNLSIISQVCEIDFHITIPDVKAIFIGYGIIRATILNRNNYSGSKKITYPEDGLLTIQHDWEIQKVNDKEI